MNASAAAANLPVGWSKRRLFDLCQFIPGKAHEPFIDPLGEFICVNSKFISTEGEVAKTCNQNITPARTDDVLLVMSDLPNGRALAKCYLVEQDELYAVNQRVCILRPRPGADPKMLFHVLNRNPYFLAFNDGVNQTHLLNSVFEKCELAVPDESVEQTRIGSALSDAGALIEGLERLIAKKRLIKQGAMQDLLTAKRRLPGFSGEWERKKLGDIMTLQRGFDLPKKERREGSIPIISSSGAEDCHSTPAKQGPGVVTGRYGTIGKVFYTDEPYWPLNTTLFVSNYHGNHPKYSYYLLTRLDFHEHSGKTGVPGVNRNDLHTVQMLTSTDPAEQAAIASVLTDMDTELQALDARLEKARQVKEGMMQNLLTGRIRLV